jgi:UDP-N-acetylglucosamine/UDP-N-acetylgalactosamine diphosphorylase
MSQTDVHAMREKLEQYGQQHVLRFWDTLNATERNALLGQLSTVDFPLMERLIQQWVLNEPDTEHFDSIEPIPVIPPVDPARSDAQEALEAGETALRQGRVGLFLVAGGQGTRLGFDGPKGAYPIGPLTGRSLFAYHASKIQNLQRRYGCVLPWYIMTSDTNDAATKAFFKENGYFGLSPKDVRFLQQRMVPCVDEQGRFMLADKGRLAMNPNGHGGCIPAMVENGIIADARERGVDMMSYFQVDNWAVKVADPYFIGYHALAKAQMSSKNCRKNEPREAVGVHCLCDGEYRVIEYSELDIYPQLLQVDQNGELQHYAGNPAIHILSVDFVDQVFANFTEFPWHRAHKKIPLLDEQGHPVEPSKPNGYKFETFVFDALRFIDHAPVALEIHRQGEYTPIKSFEGDNSVRAAWASMREYWGEWLEEAGISVPRDASGAVAVHLEIDPRFALTKEEFLARVNGSWSPEGGLAIGPDGEPEVPARQPQTL